jgi:multicomponent Na+:H+ antiporter subunit D
MERLIPLTVAGPFLVAAVLLGLATFCKQRWLFDLLAVATSMAVAVLCLFLLEASRRGILVYWFGGWRPREGVALGICFAVDPAGAIMAALAGVLVTLSLIFSWHYFEAVGTLFHSLMLIFLGAMVGFSLTGDLFNMFVFFELMGVAAYALTGYKIEETGPLQGGFNFLVMNSIGAFFVLMGIAVLYGRTGALNMAQISRTLASRPADAAVGVAMAMLMIGFMVKAAIVPFHFWLPDAHAVAPAPVSMLFSGIMVELGLFAVARVHGAVFTAVPGGSVPGVHRMLLSVGALTAVVGGIMCVAQRHLKRMLAFSTVSHGGFILSALAIPGAAGGAFMYMIGHGMVKAALFLCVGILLHRFNSVDEVALHGAARGARGTACIYFLAALGLAGAPFSATFVGKSMVEDLASASYVPWLTGIALASSILTGSAVFRAGIHVFLGWGKPSPVVTSAPATGQEERETASTRHRIPVVMWAPPAVLVAMSLAAGLTPGMVERAMDAGRQLHDPRTFAQAVLDGVSAAPPAETNFEVTAQARVVGVVIVVIAILLATTDLWLRRLASRLLPRRRMRRLYRLAVFHPLRMLHRFHSGYVGDYVAWFVFGGGILIAVIVYA